MLRTICFKVSGPRRPLSLLLPLNALVEWGGLAIPRPVEGGAGVLGLAGGRSLRALLTVHCCEGRALGRAKSRYRSGGNNKTRNTNLDLPNLREPRSAVLHRERSSLEQPTGLSLQITPFYTKQNCLSSVAKRASVLLSFCHWCVGRWRISGSRVAGHAPM